jgi:predicted HAD superfamily phosphohydrolase
MISKNEERLLAITFANAVIASEIVARVIDITPSTPAAAQAILDVISNSPKEERQIEEYTIIALTSRRHGKEVSDKLKLIVECLEIQAADSTTNNTALNAKKTLLLPLSQETKERLVIAMANRRVAKSVADKIDAAIAATVAIPEAV